MQKSGVIINLGSGRGSGKGAALAAALKIHVNVEVNVLSIFAELNPALAQLAAAQVTDLFISSGDGTIQAVVTALAETNLFNKIPKLCILPHGTTNLTAIDLGFKRRSISAQAEFIANPQVTTTVLRHTIRILNARGEGPRHGFSFGAGAAARATRLTQTDFNDQGRKGQLAALRVLAGAVGQALFTKPDPTDLKRLDRPCNITAEMEGKTVCTGAQLMMIATTLEKQFFNTKPFWGGKNGPIRFSAFAYPPPNLLRWMLPIMYGGENRKLPPSAISLSGESFNITCAEPYVMDGEFFSGPVSGPLQVEAGPAFEFITA